MRKYIVLQGRIVFLLLLVFLLGVLATGDLLAQAEKATLSGTVFDPSGAVIVFLQLAFKAAQRSSRLRRGPDPRHPSQLQGQ